MGEMELRVTDLKQFYYCPRIVYYQYVLPVDRPVTYKMEKGKAAHEEIEALESRRKLKEYGLERGRRSFDLWLKSERIGLTGRLDLLIETDDGLYPVDFKFTRDKPRKNHLYQLAGYALMLEDEREKPVHKCFVYLIPQKDAVVFDLTDEIKRACLKTLGDIRSMIREERFPSAPSERGKCADCEFQNYCRDIW
jgi:CRISPR-associated exonuclease Cas4